MFARTMTVAIGSLVFSFGCGGSQTQTGEPPSFSQYRDQELEQERKQFISEARTRLDTLENDIGLLETKLEHEAQFVDQEQRAEWSQELFEARQEKQRLSAQLDRAQNASEAEWAEMRSGFGYAVDTVQASVSKVSAEVMTAIAGLTGQGGQTQQGQAQQAIESDVGLCPIDVAGARADVEKQDDAVVLIVTTEAADQVDRLREGAQNVAAGGEYHTASAETDVANVMSVTTQVEEIEQGARIVFIPADQEQLDTLYLRIMQDEQTLGSGRCQVGPAQTGMR